MALKLYANKDNQRIKKVLITAKYVDATIEIPPFEVGKDNKTESFLKKNPLGKIPVLECRLSLFLFSLPSFSF